MYQKVLSEICRIIVLIYQFGLFYFNMGERRGSNPRMMESQSIALPLGYARQ